MSYNQSLILSNSLASKKELIELKKLTDVRFNNSDDTNRSIKDMLEEHRKVMARFDEILTEKASKLSLDSLFIKINNKLESKVDSDIFLKLYGKLAFV